MNVLLVKKGKEFMYENMFIYTGVGISPRLYVLVCVRLSLHVCSGSHVGILGLFLLKSNP